MPDQQSRFTGWFTYRSKSALQKDVELRLREANTLFVTALKEVDKQQPVVDTLIASGHKATANGFCDARAAFIKTHNSIIAEISADYKRVAKDCLRAIISQLDRYSDSLKDPKPLADWDPDPRHEIALRKEIGEKVKHVNLLRVEITRIFPGKLGSILMGHHVDMLQDFVEAMQDWSKMAHTKWLNNLDDLSAFMRTVLDLDLRMQNLKRELKELH